MSLLVLDGTRLWVCMNVTRYSQDELSLIPNLMGGPWFTNLKATNVKESIRQFAKIPWGNLKGRGRGRTFKSDATVWACTNNMRTPCQMAIVSLKCPFCEITCKVQLAHNNQV